MTKYTLYFGENVPYSFMKTYDTRQEAEEAKEKLKDPKVEVVELEFKLKKLIIGAPGLNEACLSFTSKFPKDAWQEVCLSNDAFVAGWKAAEAYRKTK